MRDLQKKGLIYLLSFSIVLWALPRKTSAAGEFAPARRTADEAAAYSSSASKAGDLRATGWMGAFADPDTTEYEFPEDEEEKDSIVREVIVWTVVAGFVAFFIIKVFLEGDKTEEEETPPGKEPPPGT